MSTDPTITPELLDQLLANYTKPKDLTGENGLFKQLKKALIERALGAEPTEHLGYEKGDPTGRGSPEDDNASAFAASQRTDAFAMFTKRWAPMPAACVASSTCPDDRVVLVACHPVKNAPDNGLSARGWRLHRRGRWQPRQRGHPALAGQVPRPRLRARPVAARDRDEQGDQGQQGPNHSDHHRQAHERARAQ
jgi:hypothetical protein